MSLISPDWTGDFSHVGSRSTAEQIAEQLRTAIMHGHLHTGLQLGEAELASSFGVSRGPVREALQRLMQEGLLTRARNRAVYVAGFSDADVRDVYLARTAIESAAIGQLLLLADPARAIEQLGRCVADMHRAARDDDRAAFTNADLEFHNVLVEASGSTRLLRMQRTLLLEARLCMTRLEDAYVDVQDAVQEHVDLVGALQTGDEARALALISEHMSLAVRLLTQQAEADDSRG